MSDSTRSMRTPRAVNQAVAAGHGVRHAGEDVDPGQTVLPAGALGDGAIYTEYGHAIHILRMIILRVGAKLDYLILKLH